MEDQTVTLHRVIAAPPEKVFRAFTNAAAYASWLPPYGYVCDVQEFDPREGGRFRMTFTNFSTSRPESFGGTFKKIDNNEFISYSDRFDNPDLPGEMTTSITFRAVIPGTELRIVQENIPVQIPVEMCYLGWQQSLDKLIKLVEPNIPDA